MSVYFAYCEKCLKQPEKSKKSYEFYDFRFDFPVCVGCVYELGLEPEEEN